MSITVCLSLSLSLLWPRRRLDLPRICGNWEYVFLLPHLAHPCPPLCHARTNLGKHPESVSPHAHRLQCVYSIDHPLMCLFMITLTAAGCTSIKHSSFWSSGSVWNFTFGGVIFQCLGLWMFYGYERPCLMQHTASSWIHAAILCAEILQSSIIWDHDWSLSLYDNKRTWREHFFFPQGIGVKYTVFRKVEGKWIVICY